MIKAIPYMLVLIAGMIIQAKLLSKPTVKNYFKRFKQKKGQDNIMTVSNNKDSSGTIYASDTRKQVIDKWKQLKKE